MRFSSARNWRRRCAFVSAGVAITSESDKRCTVVKGAQRHPGVTVGLKPGRGWLRRNFIMEVYLPSLFSRRLGVRHRSNALPPPFPVLRGNDISLTWIGHASFLISWRGLNLLIDPIWSLWLKVIKRMRHPGVRLDHLPAIDLVLVTHAHFDHLDRRTLRKIAAAQPIIVPSGVGNLVRGLGFNRVHEMGCWETLSLNDVAVTMTPCHHWGARVLHDRYRGFGGFHFKFGDRSVFHCGDSAYFGGFKEIGERLPTEIALLPIGAYEPLTKREVHMNPEQAVRAFSELCAKTLVPMHYGTFRLSYEPLDEPLNRFQAEVDRCNLGHRVRILQEGMPTVF
ncbi:MAG: MBL fold metallo-hydrolase [Verrucomicrobia bacterium]|nr:MBL fold metallo-hydrolase [Verrucomicrobiota bacterium]